MAPKCNTTYDMAIVDAIVSYFTFPLLDHSELRRTRSYCSEPGTVCSMTAIDVEREYESILSIFLLCTVVKLLSFSD